jgi:hypothetical protein
MDDTARCHGTSSWRLVDPSWTAGPDRPSLLRIRFVREVFSSGIDDVRGQFPRRLLIHDLVLDPESGL